MIESVALDGSFQEESKRNEEKAENRVFAWLKGWELATQDSIGQKTRRAFQEG